MPPPRGFTGLPQIRYNQKSLITEKIIGGKVLLGVFMIFGGVISVPEGLKNAPPDL
ncbi:Uncharacterized protein dnm_035980 [Desulfonema magnum]|uniref:Uncharacterized protein n=1 Tax=Desulfonema magnum TaxID=45655 RepID=A0A975BM74_9BACT|nr:Uncharacterized protein dnm_035980 [Desulfonema magnum]